MPSPEFIHHFALAWIILAGLTFPLLFFIPAPYGRHNREGWGPNIPSTLGWIIMETPAVLVLPVMLLLSTQREEIMAWIFVAMWSAHYVHRAWIYPFRRKNKEKGMPILVALFAIIFNGCNGFLNGAFLFYLLPARGLDWLTSPFFLIGFALFVIGMVINIQSDNLLARLGRDSEGKYQIPQGGAYKFVSSPNYMGEIIEWFGWTIATWSLGGLCFALWTAANLVPRAITNHQWYKENFSEYPQERKAIIPFLL